MRLVGVSLMLFGAAVAWFLGVKGEDTATLRAQVFAFFHITDPGTVLPAGAAAPTAASLNFSGLPLGGLLGAGARAAANAARAAADAGRRAIGGSPAPPLAPPVQQGHPVS